MTASDVYHVGILVNDLAEGMARFSTVLGLSFDEPKTVPLTLEIDGKAVPGEVTCVYSVEGPPFVELIEAQADGLWGHQHGEGLHHIGSWEEDLEARLEELLAEGALVDVKAAIGDQFVAAYLKPEPIHNTRLELVARKAESVLPSAKVRGVAP
jgi:catechol 2,3-dioxygenase-like lactoylglutathione lyase family enzyme